MLARQADVNARDSAGLLAIDYAEPGNRDILELLRKAGSRTPIGRSARMVCDAQRSLLRSGYDTEIIDCIAGQQFRAALTKFQIDHGLRPTGKLEPETRKALDLKP